jgi:hypothetical protein
MNEGITVYKSEGSTSFPEDRSYKLNNLEGGNAPVFLHATVKGNFFLVSIDSQLFSL